MQDWNDERSMMMIDQRAADCGLPVREADAIIRLDFQGDAVICSEGASGISQVREGLDSGVSRIQALKERPNLYEHC